MARLTQSALLHLPGVHRQRPTLFFAPSLRATPVWALADLPAAQQRGLRALQAHTTEILSEYDALQADAVPSDYSTKDPARQDGEHKLHSGAWDWHSYMKKGVRQASFAARCPTTASLLEAVPGLMSGSPFGFAFFSTLRPDSTIAAHTSPCNLRVRCHLPLKLPQPASPAALGMKLAGEVLLWKEGEVLAFDDSYEHSVWNHTREPRVLLLLDLWHPELSEMDQSAISDMFQRAQEERENAAS